jgi:hypothetical protein
MFFPRGDDSSFSSRMDGMTTITSANDVRPMTAVSGAGFQKKLFVGGKRCFVKL